MIAFAWLIAMVPQSMNIVVLKFDIPIIIPCSYSNVTEALVNWMRTEVRAACVLKGVRPQGISVLVGRIKLIKQEQTRVTASVDRQDGVDSNWDKPFIQRCFAPPPLLARVCDIVVATFSLQAGFSIDSHV
ncbi:unnamed protein product, partial [Laminaria digitata]